MTDLIEWYFNSSKHGIVENVTQDVDQVLNSANNQYIVMHNIKVQKDINCLCNTHAEKNRFLSVTARGNVLVRNGRYCGISLLFTR